MNGGYWFRKRGESLRDAAIWFGLLFLFMFAVLDLLLVQAIIIASGGVLILFTGFFVHEKMSEEDDRFSRLKSVYFRIAFVVALAIGGSFGLFLLWIIFKVVADFISTFF